MTAATSLMQKQAKLFVVAVCLTTLAGIAVAIYPWRGMSWSASRALKNADSYELFSLQPYLQWRDLSQPDFHGFQILGNTIVGDRETRGRLNSSFIAGTREADISPFACFEPRHGIRVVRNGKTTDFLICFTCKQVQVWTGDDANHEYFLVASTPQPVFDEVLKKAGVPLPQN